MLPTFFPLIKGEGIITLCITLVTTFYLEKSRAQSVLDICVVYVLFSPLIGGLMKATRCLAVWDSKHKPLNVPRGAAGSHAGDICVALDSVLTLAQMSGLE